MCGIFGIITPKPTKFDFTTFCVLGSNNDSRGGDSCGIFIDKNYEYGVNEQKLFYNFYPNSKLLKSTTKCTVALGHCRKASVGAINADNAQPVIIKNDNGEVEYVLIHNGTIVNYKELAAKYIPKIDITNMTDSQVMARIFYYAGYKVLGEYIGAGAFVMIDYRSESPQVFIFKGKSKINTYSTAATVERPLYCTYNNKEFIFSSTLDYLEALRPKREALTISPNLLLSLSNGELSIVEKYDRDNLTQTKSYAAPVYTNYYKSPKFTGNGYYYCDNNYNGNYDGGFWSKIVDFSDDSYFIGKQKAHGVFLVDRIGNIEEDKNEEKNRNLFKVAFWKGVLLKNISCFTYLTAFAEELECEPTELMSFFPDLVHYLSSCPYWKNSKGIWVKSDTPSSNHPYTGEAMFPFTAARLVIKNGKQIDYMTSSFENTFALVKAYNNCKIDYDYIGRCL